MPPYFAFWKNHAGRDGALTVVDGLRAAVAGQPAQFAELVLPYRFSVGLWCGVPGAGDPQAAGQAGGSTDVRFSYPEPVFSRDQLKGFR